MFESVGRTKKQDRRQQFGSLLLSLAVNGGFIGGLIWAGATVAEEVVDRVGEPGLDGRLVGRRRRERPVGREEVVPEGL